MQMCRWPASAPTRMPLHCSPTTVRSPGWRSSRSSSTRRRSAARRCSCGGRPLRSPRGSGAVRGRCGRRHRRPPRISSPHASSPRPPTSGQRYEPAEPAPLMGGGWGGGRVRWSPALDDPAFWAGDAEADLARLRAESPVHWYEPGKFWALTRHADVLAVSKDPASFCSSQGVLMADRDRTVVAADSILYVDPPVHARYRKLVSAGFTSRRVAALEEQVRRLAREVLEAIDPTDEVDLVEAVAAPLPLLVIAELLGVPASDRDQFRIWSDAVMEAASQITDENALLALELMDYFTKALADRARTPRDDLLSVLVNAEVDGDRLTLGEQIGFCMSLLVAGNETTRSAISGGLVALAEHPDQRSRLPGGPPPVSIALGK